jgi:hypothetical protein
VKPWSIFAFDTALDPVRLASDCASWGIARAVLHPGFLEDGRFAAALRVHGRELWLNLPVFHAPEHLQAHPEQYALTWRGERAVCGWLHMGCPSSDELVEARRSLLTAALDRAGPSVLSLDFLRFHVHWEDVPLDGDPAAVVDGCYCPRCLAGFARFAGERAARGPDGSIAVEQWPAWARWKTARIGAVAGELASAIRSRAPGVPLLVKTIPWGPEQLADGLRRVVGQDVEMLARATDGALPMALTHFLGRDPAWRRALLDDVERRTGKPVAAYLQVDTTAGEPVPLPLLERDLEALAVEERAPVVFCYELLARDAARAALVRRHASRAVRGPAA